MFVNISVVVVPLVKKTLSNFIAYYMVPTRQKRQTKDNAEDCIDRVLVG